jgi:hypothetical protein
MKNIEPEKMTMCEVIPTALRRKKTGLSFARFWKIWFFYERAKHQLWQKRKELEHLFCTDEIYKYREWLHSSEQIK